MKNYENKNAWIYIIDDDFQIVYTNANIISKQSSDLFTKPCFKEICDEDSQCQKCPIRLENHGKSILYDKLHQEWVNVTSGQIDWPGKGKCHLVLSSRVNEFDSNYVESGKEDYNELLELNYLHDRFNVIYHGQRQNLDGFLTSSIKQSVLKVANEKIFEADRERFCEFWCLDEVGMEKIPEAFNSPRHGEFRRKNQDGTFSWIQQILIPIRKISNQTFFVMSFFNEIEMVEPEVKFETNLQESHMIYGIKDFYIKMEETLKSSSDDFIPCIVSIDIEKFNLFNEWYGREAGDRLLEGIELCLKNLQTSISGVAGNFGEDDFAFFMKDDEKHIKILYDTIKQEIVKHSGKMNVLPAFGIYRIENKNEPVFKMYDRAKLACSAVKGNYISRIKRFELKMLEAIQSEYLLLTDIQNAFQKNEFYFVLQPKCDMNTGKIVGAEALARWHNGEKGNISPGIFIPFLEKSGLVTELDTYIWEEVVKWQRKMLDAALDTVPVSVNISRIDVSSINVPVYFKNLIQKYQLNPKWIELEITESAYSENAEGINDIVDELRSLGFRVLMDDFGSAYSSLNMLKDITVDEIKVDMRFLDLNESNVGKGIDILETVCNMAQILGLDIIAEGVETIEQKAFLLKSGCSRAQGYYFYRPMNTSDFEKEVIKTKDIPLEKKNAKSELFNIKDLLDKNVLSSNMLMNMLGAIAFYEVYEQEVKVIRYNEKYAKILGYNDLYDEHSINIESELYEEDYDKIFGMFIEARNNRHFGASLDVRRKRPNGKDKWLHLKVYFLYHKDGRSIYYANVTDVTEVHQNNLALNFLNNDMPGGYYRHKNNADCDFTHISQRFLDVFGYTRQEIKELFDDKFIKMVHPEDRKTVKSGMQSLEQVGGDYFRTYRMRGKKGYIVVLDQCRLVRFGNDEVYQGIVMTNLEQYMWLNKDTNIQSQNDLDLTYMPCGICCTEADGKYQFSYVSNSMLHMLGYTRKDFEKKFNNSIYNLIYEADRESVIKELNEQLQKSIFVSSEFRVELADGSLMWVYGHSRLSIDAQGKRLFYTCIMDTSLLKEKYQIQEWQNLKYKTLMEIPGVVVYDYDPETDKLTLELSNEDGTQKKIVAENYIERIEEGGMLSPECVKTQKTIMLQAISKPQKGVTEFAADFTRKNVYEWYRFHYISLADDSGKVNRLIGRGENITEEKNKIFLWKERATKDSLTGLLNFESLKDISSDLLNEQKKGTLILFDIDNFKKVNDSYGHLVGDQLLINIANLLKQIFDDGAILSRFGGDEFVAYIPNTPEKEKVIQKANLFLQEISQIKLSNCEYAKTSIGIASTSDYLITFEELFQKADKALYQSKNNGKNQYTFYEVKK